MWTIVDLGPATASRDGNITNDAPDAFPLDNTTVTWAIIDAVGNEATDTQIVTIVRPVAMIELANTAVPSIIPPGRILAYDLPDEIAGITQNISCDPQSGSLFPIGHTAITCTSTDAGNTTSLVLCHSYRARSLCNYNL